MPHTHRTAETLEVLVLRTSPDGQPRLDLEPQRREPTVHDLMRHTAGLVHDQLETGEIYKAYLASKVLDFDAPLSTLIERMSKLPLSHRPGDTSEYSVAVNIKGRTIEVVSDERVDRYRKETVTFRVGPASIDFHVAPGAADGLGGRDKRGGPPRCAQARLHQHALVSGGGGLYGDAGDILRFCQMLPNGGEPDGAPSCR